METIRGLVQNNEGKHPGYCLKHRTNICQKRKDGVCDKCSQEISEILKEHHSQVSLENWNKLNQRQQFEYFFHNQLRRKKLYKDYLPRPRNLLSSKKNLSNIKKANELELGQIYEVFEKFINDMIQRYKFHHNLGTMEQDDFLKNFYNADSISDFVQYNIIDRKFSFNFIDEDHLKNTLFSDYQNDIKTLIKSNKETPEISDIKVKINNEEVSINSIPDFYIKKKEYNTLSEQIKNIFNQINDGDYILEGTKENIKAIKRYLKIVCYIEGLTQTSKYLADNYITDILKERKENIIKTGINQEDVSIATNKNPERATEKIIKDYNGNLEKLRDLSRASITFDTQIDLVTGSINFIEILEKYNKSELDERKKVTDISFVSKFGYPRTTSQKNSGYRDAKFLIKLGDGNVVEIQLHIRQLLKSKYEGINTIRDKSLVEIISLLNFTPEDHNRINNIIDSIDWHKSKKTKPEYLNELKPEDILSSDQIYSIYRLLNTYDRRNQKAQNKKLSERTLLEKLQYLEKEINHEGYRLMIDKMFGIFSDKQEKPKREKIISDLKTHKE